MELKNYVIVKEQQKTDSAEDVAPNPPKEEEFVPPPPHPLLKLADAPLPPPLLAASSTSGTVKENEVLVPASSQKPYAHRGKSILASEDPIQRELQEQAFAETKVEEVDFFFKSLFTKRQGI